MSSTDFLRGRLEAQYGEEGTAQIAAGFRRRPVTLRVNRLKTDRDAVTRALEEAGIAWQPVEWYADALILPGAREPAVRALPVYERGEIYLQSLSSMLPPLLLDPKAGEGVLDMAAAPGGKTTQLAALSGGAAPITACEKNRVRAERLKYNLAKQGAGRVSVMVTDARRLDDWFSFDKILLDAPCSGSGTVMLTSDGSGCAVTEELLQRSVRTQAALLQKAWRLLKAGGILVYSTCSVLREENDGLLQRVMPRDAEILPVDAERIVGIPLLPTGLDGTVCIRPDGLYEGFFAAVLRKRPAGKP